MNLFKRNKESGSLSEETKNSNAKGISQVPRKKKRSRKFVILIAVVLAVIALIVIWRLLISTDSSKTDSEIHTGVVMRGEISNEMTSSGTLSPNDMYTITSLVTGEIISADFEEGDQVTEGQVLYVIDQSDIAQSLESAERSLSEAQTTYNKAMNQLGGGTVKSTQTGYIETISIHAGDTVQGQATIGTLYNDDSMTLRVAFLNTEADMLSVGQDVIVTLSDTGEQIPGRIDQKSDEIQTIDSGVLVKYIEVTVTNPGGLTTSDRGTVSVGGLTSVSDGTFEAYLSEVNLTVELPSQVKIASVLIGEGDAVTNGTPLFTITTDSYNEAVTSAEDALIEAQNNLTNSQEKADNYTITAPISGQVIAKYMKAGDNLSDTANSTLALIYDLSCLTFEMSIDELDISNIEVGQEVEVTADAFEDETYTGYVSNVSLAGTSQNGVTTYPVVVTIEDTGSLLPGMNVDGTIILERSEDTLYIPSSALMRGNIVYVQNDSLSSGNVSTSEGSLSEGSGKSESQGTSSTSAEVLSLATPPDEISSDAESLDETIGSSVERNETIQSEGDGSESAEVLEAQGNNVVSESLLGSRDVPEGFTAVEVETGIISDDYVEILSGLSEGQTVYLSDDASTDTSDMMGFMGGGDFGGGGGGGMPPGGGGGPGF